MEINALNIIVDILVGSCAGAGISLLLRTYFNEKIKNSVKHEYDIRLESYKSELKNSVDKDLEVYKSQIRELEQKTSDKWTLKREACLKALNLSDSALSNMDWNDKNADKIVKSKIDTVEVRECYNQLACSCDLPETLTTFKKTLGLLGPVNGDIILEFRNVIRRELDFGQQIESDRDTPFIGRIQGDEK